MLMSKPKCVTLNGHHDTLEGINERMVYVLVCIELQLKGSIENCDGIQGKEWSSCIHDAVIVVGVVYCIVSFLNSLLLCLCGME